MIVEKQMECRLAGETEVLGENSRPVTGIALHLPDGACSISDSITPSDG
jgi:hypothetical protein